MRLVLGVAVAYVVSELALRAAVRSGRRQGVRQGHDIAVRWMLENACAPVGWSPDKEMVWS